MCLSFRRIRQPEQEEHRPWIMCPVATLPQGRSNNMAIRNFVRRKLAWILPEERSTNLEVEHENLRSPKTEGDPPRPSTEYPGTKTDRKSVEKEQSGSVRVETGGRGINKKKRK